MKLKVFLNMYGIRQEVGLLLQDKQRMSHITDADLIKTAATADISETEAKARIGQVNTVLQEYNIC